MPAIHKTRITIEVPDAIAKKFKIECAIDGKSMTEVIKPCIVRYIDSKKGIAQVVS